jgi:hypothetical protein
MNLQMLIKDVRSCERLRRTRFTGHLVGERGDHAMAA